MQAPSDSLANALAWCASILGPIEVLTDHTREHPGDRASITRLVSRDGEAILKIIPDPGHWNSEAHAYEHWAKAFGVFAPRLIAVHEDEPRAVLISALPGRVLEETQLTPQQERAVWGSAGQALASLHALEAGPFFGPVLRDGAPMGQPIMDARAYLRAELGAWQERGERINCLTGAELAIAQAALNLLPAFAHERPSACHRDYCPANWLVDERGEWAGVIDFEFSYWDVRSADFTRYPDWVWLQRPDLVEAFFAGYGRALSTAEEQQRLFSHVNYALGALVWGSENAYTVYAAEGRAALRHLGKLF